MIAAAILLGFVIYGFLAPLKIHVTTTLEPGAFSNVSGPLDGRDFVGLALSGGGARAAVFAAAGMHELARRGLLQRVTHVSSVSGGGFPASYFAVNPMPDDPGPALDQYFDEMLEVVSRDYFKLIHKNQIQNPSRLMSPSRRLLSLQQGLQDSGFLSKGTDAVFGDLPKERTFFFNTVSYDSGRRFVLGNGSLPHPGDGPASRLPSAIRTLSFSDGSTARPSPASFPISLAVATSAAFPPYLGPLTIEVEKDGGPEYWHLGDGGILENPGVETLREAFYGTDQSSGKIYSFDAGQRLTPNFTKADISMFSRDLVQFIDVILEYATGHRTTLYETLDEKFAVNLETTTFDYLDVERLLNDGLLSQDEATRWGSWNGWSGMGAATRSSAPSPAARLALIPTGFSISKEDRDLIEQAARTLVAYHVGES